MLSGIEEPNDIPAKVNPSDLLNLILNQTQQTQQHQQHQQNQQKSAQNNNNNNSPKPNQQISKTLPEIKKPSELNIKSEIFSPRSSASTPISSTLTNTDSNMPSPGSHLNNGSTQHHSQMAAAMAAAAAAFNPQSFNPFMFPNRNLITDLPHPSTQPIDFSSLYLAKLK